MNLLSLTPFPRSPQKVPVIYDHVIESLKQADTVLHHKKNVSDKKEYYLEASNTEENTKYGGADQAILFRCFGRSNKH